MSVTPEETTRPEKLRVEQGDARLYLTPGYSPEVTWQWAPGLTARMRGFTPGWSPSNLLADLPPGYRLAVGPLERRTDGTYAYSVWYKLTPGCEEATARLEEAGEGGEAD